MEVAKAGENCGRDGLVLESRTLINARSTARRPGSRGFPRQEGSTPPMPVQVLLRQRTGLQQALVCQCQAKRVVEVWLG